LPRIDARAYWSPKRDAPATDWEDACAYSEERGLLAIADGASSSYRARDWANTLVEAFTAAPPNVKDNAATRAWLGKQAATWSGTASSASASTAWYVDEATRRGAFATFLGVELVRRRRSIEWSAVAIGDSCLFHVGRQGLLASFPLDDPAAFDLTPPLVATEAHRLDGSFDALTTSSGTAHVGDALLLATDALAAWALRASKETPQVWEALSGLNARSFAALLSALREHNAIEDDDITLLQCRVV
jgi:hypothetical protein